MSFSMNPVYAAFLFNFTPEFTGKLRVIEAQFRQFRAEEAANAADPYAPPFPRGGNKEWQGTRFAEDDRGLLLSNHASFDVVQYADRPQRSSMSAIHILAIPKAPVYNGVSLTPHNVHIIEDLIALFRRAWSSPMIRRAIADHQLRAIEMRDQEAPDAYAREEALRHFRMLERSMLEGLRLEDFRFGLHLRPDHSADHLHLHIIANTFEMRRYSTSAHDWKTKDAYEVSAYVSGTTKADPDSRGRGEGNGSAM